MRRPVAFICGTYIFGIATEYFLKLNKITIFIIAACIMSVMIVLMYFYKTNRIRFKKRSLFLFFIAIIMGIVGLGAYNYQSEKVSILEKHQGEYLQLRGNVISAMEKDKESHKFLVVIQSMETEGVLLHGEKIMINLYGEYPQYYEAQGREIQVEGFIEIPQSRRNPKTFDYKTYLKTKKISVIMSVPTQGVQLSDEISCKYLNYLAKINYIFKCNVYKLFDSETAGLLMGMLFGDNSGLSDELYESFQKNGICHILAVSGLHIGAVYLCINAICGGKRKVWLNITIIASLIFYASLANFSPSVVRAVIMITIHIISKYIYCRYDMFTASMITMFVMAVWNPMLVVNLGFQLSFMAILTLAVILPSATRIYNSRITAILVIQVGIAPISAFSFNYFSFSAFVANVPVIFISGILIPLGMLLLMISVISATFPLSSECFAANIMNWLFQIIGIITEFFCKLLVFINDAAFIKNVSFKYVTSPPLWLILIYYSLLFFLCSENFRIMWQRKHYKEIFKIAAVLSCVCLIFGNCLRDGFEEVQLTFVDVGQGDCMLIKTDGGKNILIDSGGSSQYDVGKKLLLPYLLKNGVKKIDMAVITHLHQDHAGGISTLSKEIPVSKVGVYEGNYLIATQVANQLGVPEKNLIYLTKGQEIVIDEDLKIEVLYPSKQTMEEYTEIVKNQKDENALCLVMRVVFKGVSVIMTGDIDMEGERKVLEAQLKEEAWHENIPPNNIEADILKVSHHGSKYGSSREFLEALKPKLAVVQVGKNTYGHPNKDTLKRIENAGIFVYRNDISGAIGIEIEKNGKVEIHTMI